MACTLYPIKGLAKGCKDSMGGIRKVWVTTETSIPDHNCTIDTSKGIITHIDTSIVTSFKPFEFFKNTGSMTTTENQSDTAGTSFTTELSLQFMKMDTDKRLEMMGLAMDETNVIVKDSNGVYHYLGVDEPCTKSAGTGVTGTAATDLNGYTVTLKEDGTQYPRIIKDTSFIAALENVSIG